MLTITQNRKPITPKPILTGAQRQNLLDLQALARRAERQSKMMLADNTDYMATELQGTLGQMNRLRCAIQGAA